MNDEELAAERGLTAELVRTIRERLGESAESIAAMPEAVLRSAMRRLEDPDRARNRVEYELGPLSNEYGAIPEGSLATAHRQAAELKASKAYGLVAGIPTGDPVGSSPPPSILPMPPLGLEPPADSFGSMAGIEAAAGWSELGPDNVGGRTRAILVDPVNPARIFAAGVGGGVWRSLDGGQSWHPTDDLMSNLAICSLAMHPNNPQIILAGSGEGFSNVDAIRGDGIFLSSNGGDSWVRLPRTEANPDFHYVNALVYAPDGLAILAATTTGIWRSGDDGATWDQVSSEVAGNLVYHPVDPLKAIAGGLNSGKVYFSVDGGRSWHVSSVPIRGARRVQVCYARANPAVTYASVEATPSGIWRSSDGGITYRAKAATTTGGRPAGFLGPQGWYDNTIWAGDPTDEDFVIVGGIDLWRSTNGGDHLAAMSTWWDSASAHADHHVIVSHPHYDGVTNRQVYFGNDGGVYWAEDARSVGNNASPPHTNGWVSLNQGYAVTQFYHLAAHIATSTIMGGTQDNGTLARTPSSGSSWVKTYGGDGGTCASDPRDPAIWYGEYVYLNIFRNTNGGSSEAGTESISGRYWNGFSWQWKQPPYQITDCKNRTAEFIAPFILDPNDPDRLLAGGRSLWLSTDPRAPNTPDTGPSWRTIKGPIGNDRANNITAVAVADGNSDLICIGYGNGAIHRTTNGTSPQPVWERIDGPIRVGRQCLGLAIDPDDHDLMYATFGGYSPSNIWKTTDGAQSWTDIAGQLPEAPIRAITMHPQRSSWLYLATEVGVFTSEDRGSSWSANNEGPADVACRDLTWLGHDLVVATHGRGMFQIDLSIANAVPAPQLEFIGAETIAGPAGERVRYKLSVTNANDYPGSMFRASHDLPAYGRNQRASRTWVDIFDGATNQRIFGFSTLSTSAALSNLYFETAKGVAPPRMVYLELRDRRCSQVYESNAVAVTSDHQPVQRRVTRVDRSEGRVHVVAGDWGIETADDVIIDIRSGSYIYVVGDDDDEVPITVVNGRGGPYLRTRGDSAQGNNLTELPPI